MSRVKVKHKDSDVVIEIHRSQIANASYYGWFEWLDEEGEKAEDLKPTTVRKKSGKSKR